MAARAAERNGRAGPPDGIILAVDGGGSHTRCVVAESSGRVLGAALAGPTNVVQCAPGDVRLNLLAGMAGALGDAGVSRGRIAAVAAGHAGVFPDGRNGRYVGRYFREQLREARVVVTGDSVIALRGAIPEGVGVVVIAGTGSSVFGRDPRGGWVRAGGGGPLLGDEGSAYPIALAGLRAAWRAHDGRGRPTALVERLPRAMGAERIEDLAEKLYADGMSRERIAALARVVAGAGAAGDAVAQEVLRAAGRELGQAAAAAVRRLGLRDRCVVSYGGSVLEPEGALRDAFLDTVRSACPCAEVRPPDLPPVGGAFLLGLESGGGRATEKVRRRFGAGIRKIAEKLEARPPGS